MEYDFDLASRRLAEEIKRSGKSLAAIAAEMCARYAEIGMTITDQALSNYVGSSKPGSRNGKIRGMRLEYLACFADYFGVSVDYLSGKKCAARSPVFGFSEAMAFTGLSEVTLNLLLAEGNSPRKQPKGQLAEVLHIIADYEDLHSSDIRFSGVGLAADGFLLHISAMGLGADSLRHEGAYVLPPLETEYAFALLYAQKMGAAVTSALSDYVEEEYADWKAYQAARAPEATPEAAWKATLEAALKAAQEGAQK